MPRLPSSIDEVRALPQGTHSVVMKNVREDLGDVDLACLPRSLRYIDLTLCRNVRNLAGLQGMNELRRVDCVLCDSIEWDSVVAFRKGFPDVTLDLSGCWHFMSSDAKVRKEYDQISVDVLGMSPPDEESPSDATCTTEPFVTFDATV
jgi:hypothetical protein